MLLTSSASAIALSLALSTAAIAATTINGGGGSSPQPVYDAEFDAYTSSNPSILFSYDGVGAGAGQTAFLNNDITQFNSPANQYGTIVGTTVHFAASDASLSSSQVSGYTRAGTDGPLFQIPTIGVAVTIPYENKGQGTRLTMTDALLCGVFSGKLTNWSQVSSKATAGTIEVVYRSDSSAATFLLTQHFNAVCNASNSSFPVLPVPITKTFASLFTGGVAPANFIAQSGSSAEASTLLATPLSMGYIAPDYTSIAPGSANTTSLPVAGVTNGINNVLYRPTVANIEAGLNHAGPGSINTVPPSTASAAANPLNWIPSIPVTNSGYSIVGYSTWDLSTCYSNTAIGSALVSFLKSQYTKKSYKSIITNDGSAPLSNTAAAPFVTAVTNTFLSNANGYNLNIDNATACAGKPGR